MSYVSVPEYFGDKSVLVTGATGFMGKVLVEKLLRSCPRLKNIFILVRTKRGKTAQDRLQGYLNDRVFERLQGNPNTLKKVKMISGDVTLEDLGISELDRQEIQRECNIVFHCAATVRFDMFLRDSVNINVGGTKKVLELAAGMKNLEVFVHVSTSFCHDDEAVLEEKMYPSRYKPADIMQCMTWMDDELITTLQPKLIQPFPNNYAFTKCLSEEVLVEYQGKFPIAIARPSIVVAAVYEPMPGWVDNINGPTGMVYAAATGVLRTVYCHEETLTETIPVDTAVNGFILLAHATALDKPKEIRVCNVTQSGVNSVPWVDCGRIWKSHIAKHPLSVCLWYPNATPTSNRLWYNLLVFLTQFLPACLLDMLLYLLGQKTFMLKVYHKVQHGADLLEYYIMRQWKFNNDFFRSLKNRVSEEDNEMFGTDMSKYDVNVYMENYVKGVREFYCKEDASTLPKARRLHCQLYVLHVVSWLLLAGLALYLLYACLPAGCIYRVSVI